MRIFDVGQRDAKTILLKLQNYTINQNAQLVRFNGDSSQFTAAIANRVEVVDRVHQKCLSISTYSEMVQSFSWDRSESRLASVSKDRTIQLWDRRSGCQDITSSHKGIKDTRVVWLDENHIISSGI